MSAAEVQIKDMCAQIHAQREEILKAFLAKYELFPEEAEQVTQHNADGSLTWFVRKREAP